MHARAITGLLVLGVLAVPDAAAAQDAAPPPSASTTSQPPPPLPPATSAEPAPTTPPDVPPEWMTTPLGPPRAAPIEVLPPPTQTPPAPPVPAPPLPAEPERDAIFKAGATPMRPVDTRVFASFGADWLRELPRFSHEGRELPSSGPLGMWRLQAGIDLVLSRRYVVALGAIGVGGTLGPTDRIMTSTEGSPVALRPWTTGMITLSGPGLGLRITERRWTFAGTARGVLSYLWMDAEIVRGRIQETTVDRWVPGLRLDFEACRRISPQDNACLFVEARTYDTTLFNGGSVGLRWEFGG
jgi:hypothetical protein